MTAPSDDFNRIQGVALWEDILSPRNFSEADEENLGILAQTLANRTQYLRGVVDALRTNLAMVAPEVFAHPYGGLVIVSDGDGFAEVAALDPALMTDTMGTVRIGGATYDVSTVDVEVNMPDLGSARVKLVRWESVAQIVSTLAAVKAAPEVMTAAQRAARSWANYQKGYPVMDADTGAVAWLFAPATGEFRTASGEVSA